MVVEDRSEVRAVAGVGEVEAEDQTGEVAS